MNKVLTKPDVFETINIYVVPLPNNDLDLIHNHSTRNFEIRRDQYEEIFNELKDPVNRDSFYILEALILESTNGINDESILKWLVHKLYIELDFSRGDWSWTSVNDAEYEKYIFHCLRLSCTILFQLARMDSSEIELSLDCLDTLSWYINCYAPWSSDLKAKLVSDFFLNQPDVIQYVNSYIPDFIEKKVRPLLLAVSSLNRSDVGNKSLSNPRLGKSGYAKPASRFQLHGGLRPRLGFSGISEDIKGDQHRKTWKQSSRVRSISQVYYLIFLADKSPHFENYWPYITSFILNLLDDSEIKYKVQGIQLLDYFVYMNRSNSKDHILVKSRLLELFIESLKGCLHYLPDITSILDSFDLLNVSYPLIMKLFELKEDFLPDFLSLLDENIVASIKHLSFSSSKMENFKLIKLLLGELELAICEYVGSSIIASFPKINPTINNILTEPYILECGDIGEACIEKALLIHRLVLDIFINGDTIEEKDLLLNYMLDLLSAWCILYRRIVLRRYECRDGVSLIDECKENVTRLRVLAQLCSRATELDSIFTEICEKNDIFKDLFRTLTL